MAIELATAYVSLVPETSKLEAGVKAAFSNVGKQAEVAGKDMGSRLARTATKALKDGWRPDQDIMAGIPDTKLDRVGARIGQVIGKGISGGIRAHQIGKEFGSSFAQGAGSVGLGSVISGWRNDLKDQPHKLGYLAGKGISAGLQVGLAGATAIVGTALKTGFDRLVALDTAQSKLRAILRTQGKPQDFDKINKAVQKSVDKTPFSLDQAFNTAVQAVGAGSQDIERFMKNVADAAGFAGTDLERMGLIFNQVLAKGKLTGEETMQLMEAGLPARSWIQKSYNLTAAQFDDMAEKGQVTLDMLQRAIEDNAPGMAQALGNTLQGSIDNMQTALAKTGANFLAAIFGGPTGDAAEGLKSAVQRITEMLNNLNAWIIANKDNIREFFNTAKDVAGQLLEVLGNVASVLKEHPGLIGAVVTAFVAWETIKGISTVLTAVNGITTALGAMPGLAAAANAPLAALMAILAGGAVNAAVIQDAMNDVGPDSEAGRNIRNQMTAPGMGVPGASRDPIFQPSDDPWFGGGASFSDEYAIGSGANGRVPGTAGRGYFNSRAAAAYLDRRTMSDASLLSSVPAGRYTQEERGDLTQGLADCTSAIEDLVNMIDGRPTAGASLTTSNAADWLTSRGFRPGTAPGAFNVGFWDGPGNSGHMQATLPGGTPFNWGSKQSAANRGIGGTGAFDPALTQRYYRYDEGGVLPPGMTLVQNDTGKPELILNPEQQQALSDQGVDPNTLLHGNSGGAAPGPNTPHMGSGAAPGPDGQQQTNYGMDFVRSLGFIPASAGSTSVAGTSSLAGFINMGNSVVSGVIDTGVNLANQAVSAAIAAGVAGGSFGGAAAAAPLAQMAASYGVQLAGNQAKRISQYWFGLAGIGADALIEQLSPFGTPRWLGYDYTSFAPQLGIQQAALGTVEKMGADAIGKAFPAGQTGIQPASPAGPVTPSTMPGAAQPIPSPPPDAPSPPPSGPTTPTMDLIPNLMGYDQGGMLPPGGMGINMTNRPEPVLTPQQWDAIASSSSEPSRSGPLVENLYAQDMQDAIRKLEQVKRRDLMQYAGRP